MTGSNTSSYHILIVEDEKDIADAIKLRLNSSGHRVTVISDGRKALDFIQHFQDNSSPLEKELSPPRLYLLDRMLPAVTGLEICRFLRLNRSTQNVPILLITALTAPEQIVEGLDAGADDYITKPFDMNILMARVRSLIRRHEQIVESSGETKKKVIFTLGKIKLDSSQCKTWIDGEEIDLTLSEYKLLLAFLQGPGKVMTRNQLVDCIQDGPVHVTHRVIDTHIFGLRKKLKESAALIETVRGVGYRVAAYLPTDSTSHSSPNN